MNPEQQRIAIAKACGWTGFNPDNIPDCLQFTAKNPDGKWEMIPDYLNDLNAMHKAETTLQHYGYFVDKLAEVMGEVRQSILLPHATAAQRAEAFLKTIGKWEGEQP